LTKIKDVVNKLWKEKMPKDKCSKSADLADVDLEQQAALRTESSSEGPHCVCIKNKKGKKFCCTRKTSTAKFIQQFTLWSIKSCTTSVNSALDCLRALDESGTLSSWMGVLCRTCKTRKIERPVNPFLKFVNNTIAVYTCFLEKSGKKLKFKKFKNLKGGDLKKATKTIKHAIQVVLKDFKNSLFDVRNLFGEEILDQMLDGRNKALLAQEHVSPHGLNDRFFNKLPDNMDDHSGSKVKFSGIPEDLALDNEYGGGAAC